MKIERTRIHLSATFSLPSPSSDLKVPIMEIKDGVIRRVRPRRKTPFEMSIIII